MSRYIDADELLKEASKDGAYGYVSAEQIADFPTADVAEVVRCGECKHYDRRRDVCHNPRWGDGWANYPSPSVNEDFSCADGAKMEEVEE